MAAEPFEQQRFGTAGVEGVNRWDEMKQDKLEATSQKTSHPGQLSLAIHPWIGARTRLNETKT